MRPCPSVLLAFFLSACTPKRDAEAVDAEAVVAEPLDDVTTPVVAVDPTPGPAADADPLLGFRHEGAVIHPLALAAAAPLDWSIREPIIVDLALQPTIDEHVETGGAHISFDDPEPGWVSYTVTGRAGDRFLLDVTQSGGGTGIFSTTLVVELRDGTLVPVMKIGAGDRCNGGHAEHPSFDGDAVLVYRWLTPDDFVRFSSRDLGDRLAGKVLEFSAMSCIGFATFRAEPGRFDPDETLVSITFAPGIDGQWHADQPGWTELYSLQPKFNELYAKRVAAGETVLDPAAIDRFIDELLAD